MSQTPSETELVELLHSTRSEVAAVRADIQEMRSMTENLLTLYDGLILKATNNAEQIGRLTQLVVTLQGSADGFLESEANVRRARVHPKSSIASGTSSGGKKVGKSLISKVKDNRSS